MKTREQSQTGKIKIVSLNNSLFINGINFAWICVYLNNPGAAAIDVKRIFNCIKNLEKWQGKMRIQFFICMTPHAFGPGDSNRKLA